jgi:hypothetical protein
VRYEYCLAVIVLALAATINLIAFQPQPPTD